VPLNSEFRTAGMDPTSPLVDWRSALGSLGRIDLNRFLPPYPHQGRGLDPASYRPAPLVGDGARFDAGGPEVSRQLLAAQAARQRLADDVYRCLLAVTGVAAPANPARPTQRELRPRRWLAQLAANIVDLIDEDEISTPFLFYKAADAGDPAFNAGAVSARNPELPRYWVFGTELPRVILNEALVEYQRPAADGVVSVNVWAELVNPLPAGPFPGPVQAMDAQPVPMYVPAAGALSGYSPYRVLLANTNPNPGGPLLPRPGNNDNVLGTPDVVNAATDDVDFAARVTTVADATTPVPAQVPPQGFFLLGPPVPDARGTITAPRVPGDTPFLRSANLQYPVLFTQPDTWLPDYRRTGLNVVLRRLANPYLPFDPRPALGPTPNPAYNPYQTVDFMPGVPLNDATLPATTYASWGKRQPYASEPGQAAPQASVAGSNTWHTFGLTNNPVPASGHYDWLVHFDRQLVSPMELVHVSGFPPHELTQRFGGSSSPRPFGQRVPWFDQSNRLYRAFAFLGTGSRVAGTAAGGRVAGRVNVNTIWDPETLLALCDPQPANGFMAAQVANPADPTDPNTIFGRLLALRTPGGVPGAKDRPFLGLGVGHSPAPADESYPPGGDSLFPLGSGINDTLLRSATEGDATTPRLFEVPGAPHPYWKYELLAKLSNRVTTRSNVFAVWLTVGFFEVRDDSTRPVKLGAEIGRDLGLQRRHRLFAVVDRTRLKLFATRSQTAVVLPTGQTSVQVQVTPERMSATNANGRTYGIRVGSAVTVDEGGNEETVMVTAVTPTTFTATFTRAHAAGVAVVRRGNPGPQPGFDPAADPDLVLHSSIIE
jgi:hypothetical protein